MDGGLQYASDRRRHINTIKIKLSRVLTCNKAHSNAKYAVKSTREIKKQPPPSNNSKMGIARGIKVWKMRLKKRKIVVDAIRVAF